MEDNVVPLKLVEAIEVLQRSHVMADIRVAKFWGRKFVEIDSHSTIEIDWPHRRDRLVSALKTLSYTVEDKDGKLKISW